MTLYLFLYSIYILLFFIVGVLIYKKHIKSYYGRYLFFSIIIFTIWFLFYVLSFSTTYNKEILLYISRILYFLSLVGTYGMIFYVITYFNNYSKNTLKKINYIFIFIFILLLLASVFSQFFIKDMIYNADLGIYYENFGSLFLIYEVLYLISPFLFLTLAYKRYKTLKGISKLRFIYIVIGFGTSIISGMFVYIFLPTIGIWILQKEQVLFYTPFLLGLLYSIYKYHFVDLRILIGKIVVFFLSLFYSIFFVNIIKYYFLNMDKRLVYFWGFSNDFGIIDLSLAILIFIYLHNFLAKSFLVNSRLDTSKGKLTKLKSQISFISNFIELNNFLKIKAKELFNISYVNIKLFNKNDFNLELYKYFKKDISRDLFINDIVFIEENKYKFDRNLLIKQLDKKSYLILPLINNKREFIGVFELGTKPFKDNYNTGEIEEIKIFTEFIVGHLKYLDIYTDIHDLNINLEKKVDEKTIKYNTLLNKRKEFISMASHEIKTPVASSIFQMDYLIDSFEEEDHGNIDFPKEFKVLNDQLLKLGDLVNKIFSVEEYDIKEIKLFKEKINLNKLLEKEISSFKKVNKKIKLTLDIDDGIGYVDIDKVQFTQVIDNLLNNAKKFALKDKPIISLSCKMKKDFFYIHIEDNGIGLKDINVSEIFNKYSTGSSSKIGVGLGLGLYLCKTIVGMHGGTIKANKSDKLGGARFIIKIPFNK